MQYILLNLNEIKNCPVCDKRLLKVKNQSNCNSYICIDKINHIFKINKNQQNEIILIKFVINIFYKIEVFYDENITKFSIFNQLSQKDDIYVNNSLFIKLNEDFNFINFKNKLLNYIMLF